MATATILELHGCAVAYEDYGRPGPQAPTILLHGFTGGKHDFAAVAPQLATQRRVLVPDLPGHGGSAGSDDPDAYALAAVAHWVLDFASAVGAEQFHLVGHSLGGQVAQRVALAASQRLVSLVLADTGLGILRPEAAQHVSRIGQAAMTGGAAGALAASAAVAIEIGRRFGVPGPTPQELDFQRRHYLALEPAAIVGGVRNLVTAAPLGAFWRGIAVPVLVLYGAQDYIWTPDEQALLAATIRGAKTAVIADSWHSPQRENPTAWLDAVIAFHGGADH